MKSVNINCPACNKSGLAKLENYGDEQIAICPNCGNEILFHKDKIASDWKSLFTMILMMGKIM